MDEIMSNARKKKITQTPEGLTIRRQGESLETVNSKTGEFRLLSTHSNSEVMEIHLNEGERLVLTPAGSTVETFYVLSGQLSSELAKRTYLVTQGDYIVTEKLSEPRILTAMVDAKLLYITEQPQFHAFSENLTQLRQLAVEVELKDGYTAYHCERLHDLSFSTGQVLDLPSDRLMLLGYGAYLHDVGKIRVPLAILTKPGKLTAREWKVIKKHPTYGRELLAQTFMKEAGTIVEQHHERSDGSGYPKGLLGNDILIESYIVAVADTFDAMTTDRPYRKASTQAEALAELRKYAGIHYPKEVVKAFCSSLKINKVKK